MADWRAFLTISFVGSVTFTSGNLTLSSQRFNNFAAYFTGLGLLSTNKEWWIGCRILSSLSASSFSLLLLDFENFWKSEQSFGAIFAVTLIVPTPPLLLNSKALSSLPVNCLKS